MEIIDDSYASEYLKNSKTYARLLNASRWAILLGVAQILWILTFLIVLLAFIFQSIEYFQYFENDRSILGNPLNRIMIENMMIRYAISFGIYSLVLLFMIFKTTSLFKFASRVRKYRFTHENYTVLMAFKALKRFFLYGAIIFFLIFSGMCLSIFVLSNNMI